VGVGQDEIDIVKISNTTIVVLMPGSGDEVQAMKAGLMEIADLLVINKADRAEADKMEMELQSTLSFFQKGQEWLPKIIRTVATTGAGLELLVQGIEEHTEFLKQSGKWKDRVLLQSRQRLIDALEYQITTHIVEEGFEEFDISKRIEEIASREVDPDSVVRELLQQFVRPARRKV
jgi:LAO/AO transport system kinase